MWSEMILNYQMIVERYPKPNKVVGGSISSHIIVSLLDGKSTKWSSTSCVPKEKEKCNIHGPSLNPIVPGLELVFSHVMVLGKKTSPTLCFCLIHSNSISLH